MPEVDPKDEALDGLLCAFRSLEGLGRLLLAVDRSSERELVDFEGLGELVRSLASKVRLNTETLLDLA